MWWEADDASDQAVCGPGQALLELWRLEAGGGPRAGAHRAVTTLHSRLLSPHSHRSRSLALAILVIEWPSPRQYLALTGGNRYNSCNELQWECWMVLPCTSELWSVLSRLALCLWSSYKWVIPPVFLVSLSVSQCHLPFCPDLCSV